MTEVEGGLDEPAELEPEQGSLALASPDDGYGRADWEKAAAAVLRKAGRLSDDDPDDAAWRKLARTTLDGIAVPPLGTPDLLDELATGGRPARSGEWDIRAHLDIADAKLANEAALVDLTNGVTSLWLEVEPETDFDTLLEGVLLDLAPVVLDVPANPVAAADGFVTFAGDSDLADGTNLGADPFGAALRGVPADSSTAETLAAVAHLARETGTLAVVVDATAVHDLGATDAQELGYSLAAGAAYLRILTDAGIPLDDAAALIEFRYAASDEQFPTIAKLRAARRLWARMLELSDASTREQRQHVVTSRPRTSKYDPWVNMLRTTVAAFAAGVGGADSVTVLPFDTALGVPDALGRRIARNTSSLLISESHLSRVADPAGGAYAVEKLTDDLARVGWEELGRIEDSGGVEAALEDGSLSARLDESVARRDAEIARRKRPLTGVSEFPHLGETLPQRKPHPHDGGVRRWSAPFEALRDDPATAPVFLATMGTIAAHTARATFATNLFASGGIAVEAAGATDGVEQVVAAYAGQPVSCLAGPDATYAEWGAELVAALREAGAQWVIVAGKPGDLTGRLGVDDSCAVGVDALDFLSRTREKLS